MRFRPVGQPQGQSLLELLLLVGLISALMMMILLIGTVGMASIKTSQAARFAAFDCDNHPAFCRQKGFTPEQKIRSAMFYADRQEVFPLDAPGWKPFRSLGRHQVVLQQPEDVLLSIDLPKVDGADKSLLSKLSDLFRGVSMKAGPALFSLPTPDHLSRSTVRTVLWASSDLSTKGNLVPRLELTSRIALVTDSWAASDRADFHYRVKEGETPSLLASQAIEGLYLPGKDLLMPAFDLLGLDSNTSRFRAGFHQVDHDVAYPGTRVNDR